MPNGGKPSHLEGPARYRRCASYIAAAMIYLKGNSLLEESLQPDHIKHRLLGTGARSRG